MPPVADAGEPLLARPARARCVRRSPTTCRASTCRTSSRNDVYVIDPATFTVVGKFKVGLNPQHVVPSWDLRTLWVANNAENTNKGSLMPDRPRRRASWARRFPSTIPYNMYFSPDGKSAIVVAEAMKRLDFRDPKTMQLQYSIDVPKCAGINHADFSIDGRYAIFTCEFAGTVAKIDMVERKVLGYTQVIQPGRPDQDREGTRRPRRSDLHDVEGHAAGHPRLARRQALLRRRHDGRRRARGRPRDVPAGRLHRDRQGHARPVSARDGKQLYVANRGSNKIHGPPKGKGGVSVIDFATQKVVANWPIPGGGSPDMGNVSADGKWLWLSGRYDNVVYAFDTTQRRGEEHSGGQGAARAHGVAAARAVLAGAHGELAVTVGQASARRDVAYG